MNSMNRTLATVAVVFILIVAGVATYVMVSRWHQKEMAAGRQQAQNECLEVIQKMEADLDALRAQLAAAQDVNPAEEAVPGAFGEMLKNEDAAAEPADCGKTGSQLDAFFGYLDSRPYLAERNLDGGSAGFLRQCATDLISHPPVNIAEMRDMSRLVKNVTHFYRLLGRDRLMLAKEIMDEETRVLEPAMALFYTRLVTCGQPFPGLEKPFPIERLYDYAGYFLNTLGGRSYLLRRESKVRMLVNYYSILIVDRANDEKFNAYGIDLRPYIDYLFYDISNQKGLAYRERYLTRLTALRDKYM